MSVYERMQALVAAGQCYAFRWMGQSLEYCDGCGQPFWEHSHDERGTGRLGYHRRVIITDKQRERVMKKWKGYTAATMTDRRYW